MSGAIEPVDREVVEGELVAPPEPLVRGRFSLYEGPKRGLVFALRVDGDTEDRHFSVPPVMMKLFRRQLGVDPVEALRRYRDGEPQPRGADDASLGDPHDASGAGDGGGS